MQYKRFQDLRVGNVEIEHIAEAMRIALQEADLTYRFGLGLGCSAITVTEDEHGDHAFVSMGGTFYRITLGINEHGLREIAFRRYDKTVEPFSRESIFPVKPIKCPRPIDAVRALMDCISHDRNLEVVNAVVLRLEREVPA